MYYPKEKNIILSDYLKILASFIKDCQLESGAIVSNADGSLDPWDHCEAIMGLSTMNQFDSALKGFDWLKETQNEDGSWYAKYDDQSAIEFHKPTHFSSYITVAAFHYFLITDDKDFLRSLWRVIEKATDFTLNYQIDDGSIYWAVDDKNNIDKDSLITGSSSILKSLECGIAISKILNQKNNWNDAYLKLRECIRNSPSSFDKKKDRSNFSMDSYYPILCGALDDKDLIDSAISKTLKDFYVDGIGIKCVKNEPWVT
ncbi:MAG: phenyltransferase domain-containing protein, partial [Gammaproteobacteria bacterium]